MAAAWKAITRSRTPYSEMCSLSTRNTTVTLLSAIRVSRLPTARVTTRAPTALLHTVSTSRPPTTAPITRPQIGTIMSSPRQSSRAR